MTLSTPFTFRFLEQYGVPLRRMRTGEKLFTQGEPGDTMLLVLEGKIDIVINGEKVSTVGMHGVVGEMALIDDAPRSATAIAATGGEVAVIDQATFKDLVREDPSFALYVMGMLARRIRAGNKA